ncbi:MAG: pknH 1 [Acidobacteria bacterium]|nr:pknH 1 [Acidobacteriota bacterium]
MNPERWQQLKDLFYQAAEQDPARRAEFLSRACAGDPALREEVESLLAAHDGSDTFLEQPAREAPAEPVLETADESLSGQKLGPYSVIRKIGQGGMGVVYLAEDTRLKRQVAIKALPPGHTRNLDHRERLKREARIAATLSHPGIATVYALEEHGGNLYIVCEYVRGRTLLEAVKEGPLPPALLLEIAIEIARALVAAHEHGIIHRDLKPEHVMRTPEGAVKILDFGLARFQTAEQREWSSPNRLTKAGMFVGTPAYASPEQLLGLDVDFRTDLFSFGVMLYELASGTHPFEAADSVTTLARILEAEPAELTQVCPALPPGLDRIVKRCIRKTPLQRYATTRELLAELEGLRPGLRDKDPQASREAESAREPGKGLHPLWWWQFHQAVIGCLYYSMLYPMWQVKVWTPGNLGRLLFFLTVAAVAVGANLRFHLWFTSAYYPVELSGQRRRVAVLIRIADILFVALLLAAALVIHDDHEVITTLLVAVAIGSLCAFLLIEPTTTRAALGTRKTP